MKMISWWPIYISSACLVLLLTWMLLDATFNEAFDFLLILLGIKSDHETGLRGSFALDGLGLRVILLMLLLGITILCYVFGIWTANTHRQGTSIRGLMAYVTVASLALALLCQWQSVTWLGFRLRTLFRANEYTAASKLIFENWPMKEQSNTPLGVISSHEDLGTTLVMQLHKEGYAFQDQFGPLIHKQANRLIVDSHTYPFWKLEYHDQDSEPTDFVVDYGNFLVHHKLIQSKDISAKLYFVQYEDAMSTEGLADDFAVPIETPDP